MIKGSFFGKSREQGERTQRDGHGGALIVGKKGSGELGFDDPDHALIAGGIGRWSFLDGVISWDRRTRELYGCETPESLDAFLAYLPVESGRVIAEAVQKAQQHGRLDDIEHEVIHPNGSRHWIFCRGRVVHDEQGRFRGLAGVVIDITERRQAVDLLRESEENFRNLFNAVFEGIMLVGSEETIVDANDPLLTLLDLTRNEIIGKPVQAFFSVENTYESPPDHPGDDFGMAELHACRADGTRVPVEISIRSYTYKGERVRLISLWDISHRRRAEKAQRETERLYSLLAENSDDVIWTMDRERLKFVSPSVTRLLGHSPEMALELGLQGLMTAQSYEKLKRAVTRILDIGTRDRRPARLEAEQQRADGASVWTEVLLSPLKHGDGSMGILGVSRDITRYRELQEQLRKLTITDDLTGLYNSRYFQSRLTSETVRARRQKLPLSILFIDVDKFKGFNDSFGHLEGDRCLVELGQVIKDAVRSDLDLGFRYGGDEFIILLPGARLDDARQVAERIKTRFYESGPSRSANEILQKTLSIGMAEFRDDDTQESFIERADKAMYHAKKQGGNHVAPRGSEGS